MRSFEVRRSECRDDRRAAFIQWAYDRGYPILGILIGVQDTWAALTKAQRRDFTDAVDGHLDGAPIDWNTLTKASCPRLLSSTSSRTVESMRRKGVVQKSSLKVTRHGVVSVLVCAREERL